MEWIRWLVVDFAGSSIADENEFERLLRAKLVEAQVFRYGLRRGSRKEHVPSRFYGVRETRQDKVGCIPLYRYEVLVLFDDKVGFEDFDHVKATLELCDGSTMAVEWSRGKVRQTGEVPLRDEDELCFEELALVQAFIAGEFEGVHEEERRAFGTKFDVAEELMVVKERRVSQR